MDQVWDFIREHIYVGVSIATAIDATALPVPGRVLLIAAGALAARGDVILAGVIAAGALGAILGDHLWYLAGRRHGERLLGFYCRAVPRTNRCVSRAQDYLERFGAFTFIIGRFVAGVRVLAAPVAAGAGIGYGKFLIADIAGALLWSTTFVGLGYLLGAKAPALMERLGLAGQLAIGVGVTVIGLAIAVLVRRLSRSPRDVPRPARGRRRPAA
jgi:membrane protein DedA with SNARE-associated domain